MVQGSCRLPCFTDSEGVLNRPQEQPGEADNLRPLQGTHEGLVLEAIFRQAGQEVLGTEYSIAVEQKK
jgi:hypothetical protein